MATGTGAIAIEVVRMLARVFAPPLLIMTRKTETDVGLRSGQMRKSIAGRLMTGKTILLFIMPI
jgi:hypothetical protein